MALAYSSLRDVLPYMSMRNRLETARRVPSIRVLNRRLPFRLHTFSAGTGMMFAKQKILLRIDGDLQWKFENLYEENGMVKVTTPFGKSTEMSRIECSRFFAYYFERNRTTVANMIITNFPCDARIWFTDCARIKVFSLQIQVSKNEYSAILSPFANVQIQSVNVVDYSDSQASLIVEHVKKINIANLNIGISRTDFNVFDLKPSKKLICHEHHISMEKFLDYCRKVVIDRDNLMGSSYSGDLHDMNTLNTDGCWNQLKREMGGKEKWLDGRKCLTSATANPGSEMNITCSLAFNYWKPPTVHLTAQLDPVGRADFSCNHLIPRCMSALNFLLCFVCFHSISWMCFFYNSPHSLFRIVWMAEAFWDNYESADILILFTGQIVIYLVFAIIIELHRLVHSFEFIKTHMRSAHLHIQFNINLLRATTWVIYQIFVLVGMNCPHASLRFYPTDNDQ